jgi:ABC-type sulfate/molybdate transport systems ATPase subunit
MAVAERKTMWRVMARALADRVVRLRDGRVVAADGPSAATVRPAAAQ